MKCIICDRCGCKITENLDTHKLPTMAIAYDCNKDRKFDLCDDCYNALCDFLNLDDKGENENAESVKSFEDLFTDFSASVRVASDRFRNKCCQIREQFLSDRLTSERKGKSEKDIKD